MENKMLSNLINNLKYQLDYIKNSRHTPSKIKSLSQKQIEEMHLGDGFYDLSKLDFELKEHVNKIISSNLHITTLAGISVSEECGIFVNMHIEGRKINTVIDLEVNDKTI